MLSMRSVGGAQVQRALERGLNPLLSLFPLSLFAVAVLADLGALMSGLATFGDVAAGVLAAALLVGLVTLTVLFVDYTTTPAGSPAHRVRGLASAYTTGMVAGFTLAWYLRGDSLGSSSGFLLELLSFVGGVLGYLAVRMPGPVPVERVGDMSWLAVTGELTEVPAHSHR
jgi:uncharacterized membrane protein